MRVRRTGARAGGAGPGRWRRGADAPRRYAAGDSGRPRTGRTWHRTSERFRSDVSLDGVVRTPPLANPSPFRIPGVAPGWVTASSRRWRWWVRCGRSGRWWLMPFGIRLGPVRVGTRSAGVSVGPFSASAGYGGGSRRSRSSGSSSGSARSGPTKTQLRELAITDLVWLLQQPEFPAPSLYGAVPRLPEMLRRGEFGAAAEAVLRVSIREHGNTKGVIEGCAAHWRGVRRELTAAQAASAKSARRKAKVERREVKAARSGRSKGAWSLPAARSQEGLTQGPSSTGDAVDAGATLRACPDGHMNHHTRLVCLVCGKAIA